MSIYLSIDLLSVAVLIHTVEEDSALVVLAVGLDKLCTQGGDVYWTCVRCLGDSWALSQASWSRLGSVLGPLGASVVAWSRLGRVLGAPGASWSHCGGILSALGAVLDAFWELFKAGLEAC